MILNNVLPTASSQTSVKSRLVQLRHSRVHYLEGGSGEPVVFVHGWPTSSHLYRDILPLIAREARVLAPDLPGFGLSTAPEDCAYDGDHYDAFFTEFLDEVGVDRFTLVVHDLGGPAAMSWAVRHPERIKRLVFLNTLLYRKMHWSIPLFLVASALPGAGAFMTSRVGLRWMLKLGVQNKDRISADLVRSFVPRLSTRADRRQYRRALRGLKPRDLRKIESGLGQFQVPVRMIYGEHDPALPDVGRTAERLQEDLPQAQVTRLNHCGHFLQEDAPEEVAELIRDFLREAHSGSL